MKSSLIPSRLRDTARDVLQTLGVATASGIRAADVARARDDFVWPAQELPRLQTLETWLVKNVGRRGAAHIQHAHRSLVSLQADAAAGSKNIEVVTLSGQRLADGEELTIRPTQNRPILYVDVEANGDKSPTVYVGDEAQRRRPEGSEAWGFAEPLLGTVRLRARSSTSLKKVRIHYADEREQGNVDIYSIAPAEQGLRDGEKLTLPLPPGRRGRLIRDMTYAIYAPVRDWDDTTNREQKPTYVNIYVGGKFTDSKFVDPQPQYENAPEVDKSYRSDDYAPGRLCRATGALQFEGVNHDIPVEEDALRVLWVRVNYATESRDLERHTFRGEPIKNGEWRGKWIHPGDALKIDVDPTKEIERVEVQWSDKPGWRGPRQVGGWARATTTLDGKTIGRPNSGVASPSWQTFENQKGRRGSKLEIHVFDHEIKFYEVRVYYRKDAS